MDPIFTICQTPHATYAKTKEVFSGQTTMSFQEVKEKIVRDILGLSRGSYFENQRGILRFEAPCPQVNCLNWLYAQVSRVKVYWANRDNSFRMAGIGRADTVQGDAIDTYSTFFSTIAQRLSTNDNIRYYGGMDFYPPAVKKDTAFKRKVDQEWKAFGAYYFLLPRFEIVKRQEKCFFACNIVTQDVTETLIKDYLDDLAEVSFFLSAPVASLPKIKFFSVSPNEEEWQKLFREHIQPSGKMAYQKIVLAQKTSIKFASKVNPLAVFKKLTQQASGSFHYYFQPQDDCAFFGASPERLFKRQGLDIESEALAGTKPRGKTTNEDAHFEKILRDSPKDAREHEIVVEAIKGAFKKLSVSFQADTEPSVVKVSSAHHLITYFRGILKEAIDDARILTMLHPTPAVGGIPRIQALSAIAKLEPFERGWYAGPIGYIGSDSVDFAVALRCALIWDSYVNLYAGAGIVEGSTALEEWQEIEQKKSIFLNLFRE